MKFSDCIHDSFLLMTVPEVIAVITGIASVWFARKESILVYPVGIISVLLYVYICLNVGLYADSAINFYYFIVSIYGWYYWKHGGKFQRRENLESEIDSVLMKDEKPLKEEAEISLNQFPANFVIFIITLLIGFGLGYILDAFTNSTVPWWDGITTAIFLTAMWLMAKKKIENWIYWLIGDAACVPLFLYKGLCLSSLQYLIFTILAIAGYLSWYAKLQKKSTVA